MRLNGEDDTPTTTLSGAPYDDEIMHLFSKWSKKSLAVCFTANGNNVNLTDGSLLDREITQCLEVIIREILIMHDERLRELGFSR